MNPQDHVLREVVNDLRDIAIKFHTADQLRERLRAALGPLLAEPTIEESLMVQRDQSCEESPCQCWSANEEDYNSDSLAQLLDSHPHLTVGSVVWRGEPCRPGASELFDADDAMEMMRDRACDIAGEHADDYPNVSTEDVAELNSLIIGWIDSKAAPTFYTVKNVQPYTLTATDVGQQAEA